MKLLINESEILYFLTEISKLKLSNADRNYIESIEVPKTLQNEVIDSVRKKIKSGKIKKFLRKIPGKIESAVKEDTRIYFNEIKEYLESKRQAKKLFIKKNIKFLISRLGEDPILNSYRLNSEINGFVKSVGNSITKDYSISRRVTYRETGEDCILRNTISNDHLLVSKIKNNNPFWFIDSGYTNFLEKNKKWHRLVRNHLHSFLIQEFPVDRLEYFKTFPKQWRCNGDKILIIEPGPFSARIFNVDLKTWKYNVEKELRQYTDKKIVFREKSPKISRTPLYKHLLDEDYYCVVNINSNAATESVWAGIPVITLDKHITSPISRNMISDINNLLRPNIANWLCMLSYSQFTIEELNNGTAFQIIKKYHGIS